MSLYQNDSNTEGVDFMKIKHNVLNKGFTLIELLVTLTIITIVIALGYQLLFFGGNTFDRGEERYVAQENALYASNFITKELRMASSVEILSELPDVFDSNKRYIYLEAGILKHKMGNDTAKDVIGVLNNSADFLLLKFTSAVKSRTVGFTIEASKDSYTYSTDSMVEALNLPTDIFIDISSLDAPYEGPVVCYTIGDNVKLLTLFSIRKEHNSVDESYDIIDPSLDFTYWVPRGTDLTDLKPYFEYEGISIAVDGNIQQSGITSHNFNTNPVKYTITAKDGSTIEYTANIKEKPFVLPEALPNFDAYDPDTDLKSAPFANTILKGRYLYIANGNGDEGSSAYQWMYSNTEDGTYYPIPGATSINIKLTDYNKSYTGAGKWLKFCVTPRTASGLSGLLSLSSAKQILPKAEDRFWRDLISDLYFMSMPESEQPEDFSPTVIKRTDYEVGSSMTPDKDNFNLRLSATPGETTKFSDGGSHLYKPLIGSGDDEDYSYVPDINSFSIKLNAQVQGGSGYGVLLYGKIRTDSDDNREDGYILQYNPGQNGLLIRRITNGLHDSYNDSQIGKWYMTHGVSRTAGTWPNDEYNNRLYGRYYPQDIRNDEFLWKNTTNDIDSTYSKWFEPHDLEIVVQRQLDGSLIFKAAIIDKDGKKSNDMWFGDFGTYTIDLYKENGKPDNKTQTYYGRLLPAYPATANDKDLVFGLRAWNKYDASGLNEFNTLFNNLEIGEGFEMNIVKSEYISENMIRVEFDSELDDRTSKIDLDRIEYNGQSGKVDRVVLSQSNKKTAIIVLKENVSQQMLNGNQSSTITIERGGIRHKYAGDVKITNGNKHSIAKLVQKVVRISTSAGYITRVGNDAKIVANPPISDSQWIMVPGLADPFGVSFRLKSDESIYLRHYGFVLYPNQNTGGIFIEDATFYEVEGLNDISKSSFTSYNFPSRYMQTDRDNIRIDENPNKHNATFTITMQ